ncbi:hypothetical protein GCM10008106_20690 [Mongoliitalea lutea]|uniref:Uncharacterized protein n=1 Tax=Mongoliitalea lutea TaxID=849756 RepID=A0A8J3CYL2_9BACT|nr:hypothetical protein GCM10008106_20690 [Mongoliitalea lutea]
MPEDLVSKNCKLAFNPTTKELWIVEKGTPALIPTLNYVFSLLTFERSGLCANALLVINIKINNV